MDRGATIDDGRTLTVRVPLTFRKRGGRKQVLSPEGELCRIAASPVDNTMVKAIARAFRWRKLLENGRYQTIEEIAAAEKINPSYVCRVIRITLLSPFIVEAILNGYRNDSITLARLLRPFPLAWEEQMRALTALCKARPKTRRRS